MRAGSRPSPGHPSYRKDVVLEDGSFKRLQKCRRSRKLSDHIVRNAPSHNWRVRDNSKRARTLKQATANQASARSTLRGFSLAKQLELKDFRITSRPTPSDIEQLRTVIDKAKDERPIQGFLESHPQILAALLGRSPFVVARPNFGGKRIPDFLIADVDSRGINWVLVELETPTSPVTLRGDLLLDKYARTGTSQVEEWRI
jgi:hypothetical protein